MNFIHKVPLNLTKWLSRWTKVDKWDCFHFRSQVFFSIFYFNFNLFLLNMKRLSEEVPIIWSFRSRSKQCALSHNNSSVARVWVPSGQGSPSIPIEGWMSVPRIKGTDWLGKYKRFKVQRFPALCGFWDLKKTMLRKIRISGTVEGPLLMRKSPTSAHIDQNCGSRGSS